MKYVTFLTHCLNVQSFVHLSPILHTLYTCESVISNAFKMFTEIFLFLVYYFMQNSLFSSCLAKSALSFSTETYDIMFWQIFSKATKNKLFKRYIVIELINSPH